MPAGQGKDLPEWTTAKEVGTMSTKAKLGIVLGTAALALAAYGGYRYWKRRRVSR